ncbi:MAG: zinc ribbon domain-containing protein [Prevotella sp.]
MAIIKCPECGHAVSDKAPVCPSCGVEIAGKIIRCPQCGQLYFTHQTACPACNHPTTPATAGPMVTPTTQGATPAPVTPTPTPDPPRKKNLGLIVASVIIVLAIVCGVAAYFYINAHNGKENDAYEYALTSKDPAVLQSYLDTYNSAPQAHRDSIEVHLAQLNAAEAEWTDALVSGTRTAIAAYMSKYPGSAHEQEAIRRIDSLDWQTALAEDTEASYQSYIDNHANGEHIDEANDAMRASKAKNVQPDERAAITTLFRHFFQSINTRNEDGLGSTVASFLTSFLGKTDATKGDVITFMHRIYKDDITSMLWSMGDDILIDKREVGIDEYEYTVQFSATQDIDRSDASKEKHARYQIKATVGPDGKISAFNMTKILE